MQYYAVPSQAIFTIDQSTNQFRQSIFSAPKVKTINMADIMKAFEASKSIYLFDNEQDAIDYIENQSNYNYIEGCAKFLSPPILKVNYSGTIKASKDGQIVKPSEVALISGKMLFVGRRKVFNLSYCSVGEVSSFNSAEDTFFSSEFDLRTAAIIFTLGATLGWMADSYTVDREQTTAAVITGSVALFLYFKWCNSRIGHNEERDTNNEIQRLRYAR